MGALRLVLVCFFSYTVEKCNPNATDRDHNRTRTDRNNGTSINERDNKCFNALKYLSIWAIHLFICEQRQSYFCLIVLKGFLCRGGHLTLRRPTKYKVALEIRLLEKASEKKIENFKRLFLMLLWNSYKETRIKLDYLSHVKKNYH